MNSKISELYDKLVALKAKSTFKENIHEIKKALETEDFDNLSDIQAALAQSYLAAKNALAMTPYDTQLMAALALIDGNLAEMATGEGKTLTVALAAGALSIKNKKSVHVITANPYLAKRDAELMAPLYEKLGLKVGVIFSDQSQEDKKETYNKDIIYGTSSEFGFDYLRDNLLLNKEFKVQKKLDFAIIDEVDSVLIDEARVPLIISGLKEVNKEDILFLNSLVSKLTPGLDYFVDLKERNAELTDQGYKKVEDHFITNQIIKDAADLYSNSNLHWVRKLHSAVKAYGLYLKNKDYLVENGEILLIDQGTGRKLKGRRLSEGLHEALEAKEALDIKPDTSIQATITFQSYFGMYSHLSGLTGTAATDSEEFSELYNLTVVQIPTHRPCIRLLRPDLYFKTKKEKFDYALKLISEINKTGRPILIGCGSVAEASYVGDLLKSHSIKCEVLTAKSIDREAEIIANAGKIGQITVATNVAGRGTDIALGGELKDKALFSSEQEFNIHLEAWKEANKKIKELGGLFVLATERNFIPRVDNQLAGRCARQGDPGEVQFLVSFNDELFYSLEGNKLLKKVIDNFEQASEGIVENSVLLKFRKLAQKGHQNMGYSQRKSLVQYEAPLRDQRNTFYALRDSLLSSDSFDFFLSCVKNSVSNWGLTYITESSLESPGDLKKQFTSDFKIEAPFLKWISSEDLNEEEIREKLIEFSLTYLESKKEDFIKDDYLQKLCLETLDSKWSDHLESLEELQKNISLKSKISQNPQHHFAKEAFNLFSIFLEDGQQSIASKALDLLAGVKLTLKEDLIKKEKLKQAKVILELEKRWVKRTDTCPCGSGILFKKCHGKI